MKLPVLLAAAVAAAALTGAGATCPFSCHDHGYCTALNDEVCECWEPWASDAVCSDRACPKGPSWQGFPDTNGDVHSHMVECSNRGTCNTATGLCECDPQFYGIACELLWCENDCSGHGRCTTLRDAAAAVNHRNLVQEVHYPSTNWDAERVHGCVCEPGWEGFDCSTRSCPLGDDPMTTGTYETQVVRTLGDHTDEVQRIVITSSTDVDEVQRLLLSESTAGPDPFAGTFTFTFDSRPLFCNLCNVSAVETTEPLPRNISAADMETALEALSNIDSVAVSREDVPGHNGYVWSITFDGAFVGGNVPEMELDAARVGGDTLAVEWGTVQDGNEITGSVDLSYDDTSQFAHPGGDIGLQTIRMSVGLRDQFLGEAIAELDAIGAVETTRLTGSGPGVEWLVTFTTAVGNLSELACNPLGLSGAVDITCTVDTLVQGNFLDGNFSLAINGVPTGELDWNATAEDVQDALTDLDDTVGTIQVSRTRVYLSENLLEWSGTYEWTVTFVSLPFDYVQLTADNGTLTGAGGVEGAIVGTAERPITGTESNPDGAEVSEVQIIECTCPADCTGGVQLTLNDETTERILHDDDAATIAARLSALDAVHGVVVNLYGSPGGTFCDADGVSTAITFAYDGGNLPGLRVASTASPVTLDSAGTPAGVALTLKHGDGKFGDHGGMTKDGTRVMTPCSSRGLCDAGRCRCFFGFSRSNGAGTDLPAELGEIRNCGYQLRPITSCPGLCSGRGTCSGAPNWECTCDAPYEGAACEVVRCPAAAAWWDEPTGSSTADAHPIAACSNRGSCTQTRDGASCQCSQPFTGVACQTMNCPGPGVAPGQAGGIADGCNGHGKCMTLQELGNFSTNANGSALNGPTYADWDASKIKGCICDKYFYRGPYVFNWVDYAGHDCSHFACPYGDDPKTYNQLFNVQTVTCDASAGSFTLSFRGNSTQPVHVWFAPMGFENSLQAALEGINTIRNVTVSIDATGSICNPAMPVTSTITFVTEHGDIPLLEVDDSALTGTVVVERTVSSTKENVECNRRGKCDRSTGLCQCAPQYGSSDGRAGNGTLGDCGYLHALWQFPFPIPGQVTDATTPSD